MALLTIILNPGFHRNPKRRLPDPILSGALHNLNNKKKVFILRMDFHSEKKHRDILIEFALHQNIKKNAIIYFILHFN